ncbi:MAG: hypothetical protein JXB42_03110 [Deltaproteobacteria bacterium]|nr:hypothetical protein [Deltaproteobacteria bacterium]
MKKILLFFVLMIPLLLFIGCGYHFSPGGEHIDRAIRDVFVDNFENSTTEANIENYVRNSFIDQISRGSRFKIAAGKQLCDAVLSGIVTRIYTSHVSYASTDVAKEDRVTMIMKISFEEIKTGNVIWASESFTGQEVYTVSSNTTTTERNKKAAIRKLSDEMAEKAYRSIMSGF